MARQHKRQRNQDSQIRSVSGPTGVQSLNNAIGKLIGDTFQNPMNRTGYGMPNVAEGPQYILTRMTRDYNTLNALYRNSWLTKRIVQTIPKDMLKNWITYDCDLDPAEIGKLHKVERLTKLKKKIRDGLYWGRLYGGAAGIIMIESQEDQLEEPLDVDAIMPGDFKGLMILDRWSGIYPQLELVDDASSPDFGLPKYYQITDNTRKIVARVHHSRIIRFVGPELPNWECQAETYWGASVIEEIYEELKTRDNARTNIAGLVLRANMRIIKIKGMDALLAGTDINAQNDFMTTIQSQNYLQSNFGIMLLDAEDEFQNFDSKWQGLDDIYLCFMMDLCGATQIPLTKLFGRSPAGLNATGESDLTNYYNLIEQEQEDSLAPVIDQLLPVICMSTLGHIPDDIDYHFNPVEEPDDKEIADILKAKSEVILGYHDRGIISDKIALKEGKVMDEGFFTNVTDEDIEKASDDPKETMTAMATLNPLEDPAKMDKEDETE